MEDTVSILRGLKEKYEVHHGVGCVVLLSRHFPCERDLRCNVRRRDADGWRLLSCNRCASATAHLSPPRPCLTGTSPSAFCRTRYVEQSWQRPFQGGRLPQTLTWTRLVSTQAIDLVDEAASRLRMQQESKPEDIDRLDHDILTLRIELEALKKERDAASK